MQYSDKVEQFFQYLKKKKLGPEQHYQTIAHWTPHQIADFLIECESVFPYAEKQPRISSVFDFAATASLSGTRWPCAYIDCRFKRLEDLLRFTTLYADYVLIVNPMNLVLPSSMDDLSVVNTVRRNLSEDISLIYLLRPLLRVGLVGIAPDYLLLCSEHFHEMKEVKHRLEKGLTAALRPHLKGIRAVFEDVDAIQMHMLRLEGPAEIFEEPVYRVFSGDVEKLKRLRKSTLVKNYFSPVILDILRQEISSRGSYLTNRSLDFEIIQNLNTIDVQRRSRAILDSFSHSVPFVQEIEVRKLLLLREREGEAFQVYRDALTSALKSAKTLESHEVRELFRDEVEPEINKIDLSLRNSRKLLLDSTTTELALGAGTILVGLFNGILPKDFGGLIAAMGGVEFVKGLMKQAKELMQEPASIRDSRYYFLWKVKQQSRTVS